MCRSSSSKVFRLLGCWAFRLVSDLGALGLWRVCFGVRRSSAALEPKRCGSTALESSWRRQWRGIERRFMSQAFRKGRVSTVRKGRGHEADQNGIDAD